MAGNKYISNNAGTLTEVASVQTSAGGADAGKIVALNVATGVLDATIVNSKTTSAGAGDAGKLPALDGTGKLDMTFMPAGLGAETDAIATSESLAAGDFVNIWSSTGAKVRKADASVAGKEAHGFVLAAFTHPTTATVYRDSQLNNQKTGMTPGAKQYLSVTVPGGTQETVPTVAGQAIQRLGVAKSATEMTFLPSEPVVLA